MMKIILTVIFFLGFVNVTFAESNVEKPTNESWVRNYPYAPEKNEYQAELGGMWEKASLYWLGIAYGHHMGRCLWAESQNCQQYFDVIAGFGNRDAVSESTLLGGLRWQFVSFPKPFSPLVRVFAGGMDVRDETRNRMVGAYGAGFGFAATIHPRLDLKWELRAGQADAFWATTMVTFSMRIDHVVDYFADKVISVGHSTAHATGAIIESTLSAPKTFVDWFNHREGETPREQDRQK
jgi:hypothetical protein